MNLDDGSISRGLEGVDIVGVATSSSSPSWLNMGDRMAKKELGMERGEMGVETEALGES